LFVLPVPLPPPHAIRMPLTAAAKINNFAFNLFSSILRKLLLSCCRHAAKNRVFITIISLSHSIPSPLKLRVAAQMTSPLTTCIAPLFWMLQ
jgi:hypothetical protein